MPTDYQRIDAVCRKRGWTCTDEVFRYANGRHVGYRTLRKALPKDISDDTLASYSEDRMHIERDPQEEARALAAIERWNKANPPPKRPRKGKANRGNRAKG
jgi:hypothetical protein